MNKFPFQLSIKRSFPNDKKESLTCKVLLRTIAGRREVYDATWEGRDVIVKVFLDKISARRHLKREWRGLGLLQQRGLNCPEPLFFGRTEENHLAIVTEKIADASTALDVFNETTDKQRELELLILICRELAKQHDKGVLQKDLHLGNFLLTGKKVFALDVGQMRFSPNPISKNKSISQLALLARYLPAEETESIAKVCEEYADQRGWSFGKSEEALFQKQLIVQSNKSIRRGLRKSLRTSKRHVRIRAGEYIAVLDKNFCSGADPFDFIKQIDSLMDSGTILKDGNTCYVSHITWNGKDVVVKRYNHKGFVHSLRHTIKKSRARRGWLYGHRLGMLGIAVPKPVAYIEQRRGPLVWQSYLVTEYVEGEKLYYFLRDEKTDKDEQSQVNQQVTELLDKLKRHRITHGDLKHSNILITEDGPVLTDFDSMRAHKYNQIYQYFHKKDIDRLMKNWPKDVAAPKTNVR